MQKKPTLSKTPLVSVIIPTYKRPDLLPKAITSIAAQTMSDWEIIIVDDGINPAVNGQGIQAQFGDRFRVLRHPMTCGGAAAKNTGVNIARGKYLAFLNDDDQLSPSYLAMAVETLANNRQISTLFMNVACFGNNAEIAQDDIDAAMTKTLADAQGISEVNYLMQFDERLFLALLKDVPLPFQRMITTRTHFQRVGLYQTDCLLWDCDWALRAALNGFCGFFTVGLYLQCTDEPDDFATASYFEQCLSNFAIKKRLLANPRASRYKEQLTEAITVAGRDLASEYRAQGKSYKAVATLFDNLNHDISNAQFKYLLHTLSSYVKKNDAV